MYISTGISIETSSHTTHDVPEDIKKRLFDPIWDYTPSGETYLKKQNNTAIAIGVLVGIVCLILVFLPVFLICYYAKRGKRRAAKKKRKEERDKRESLLKVALSGGGDIEDPLVPDSVRFISTEDGETQNDIRRPSDAVLHTTSEFPWQNSNYEYEPLPRYELVQSGTHGQEQR